MGPRAQAGHEPLRICIVLAAAVVRESYHPEQGRHHPDHDPDRLGAFPLHGGNCRLAGARETVTGTRQNDDDYSLIPSWDLILFILK